MDNANRNGDKKARLFLPMFRSNYVCCGKASFAQTSGWKLNKIFKAMSVGDVEVANIFLTPNQQQFEATRLQD